MLFIITSPLLLLVIIALNGTHTEASSIWPNERLFERARCKALCLKLFQNANEQIKFIPNWNHNNREITPFEWSTCFDRSKTDCSSACFTACDLHPNECLNYCSKHSTIIGCHIGCKFSIEKVQKRFGNCPLDQQRAADKHDMSNGQRHGQNQVENKHCFQSCTYDAECKNSLARCCDVRNCLTKQCFIPSNVNNSIPPLPTILKPTASNQTDSSHVQLIWTEPYQLLVNPNNPIVFILQLRFCLCATLDEKYLSKWQTLIMTHEFGASLEAFEAGKMYQFRIAAVNVHGTRGFGLPSDTYPVKPTKPSIPGPPTNATDSMWRLYSNGKISVLLRWDPPAYSDLPLTEYLVTWSIDHGYVQSDGQPLEALTHFAQSINADKTECVLHNLEKSTSYKVEIKAVAYWHGFGKLTSKSNTLFLSTQSIQPVFHQTQTNANFNSNRKSKEFGLDSHDQSKSDKLDTSNCECGTGVQPLNLEKVFYDQNELIAKFKVNLTNYPTLNNHPHLIDWFPQVCIDVHGSIVSPVTHTTKVTPNEKTVLLSNLYFNCRYIFRLKQYVETNKSWHTLYGCFCTPSCFEIELIRGKLPHFCTAELSLPPSPPSNLQVTNLGNLNYRISWTQPPNSERKTRTAVESGPNVNADSDWLKLKYRIVWAPRMEEPVHELMYNDDIGFSPIMDFQQSDTQVLEKDQTWIALKQLRPNTVYIIKIQTLFLSQNGQEKESNPASLYFLTATKDQQQQQSHLITSSASDSSTGCKSVTSRVFSIILYTCLSEYALYLLFFI